MKKILFALAFMLFILYNTPTTVNAHSVEIDFYQMFDEHGSIMLLIDAQTGSIEHANQAASEFYGYTIEQLESMTIHKINAVSPEEVDRRMQAAAREQKNFYVIEQRLASGKMRTVEVYACPHIHGDKTLLFATINDITEKVQLKNRNGFLIVTFLLVLLGIVLILYMNNKRIKKMSKEVESYNLLRKTFIDSYENLIYLKDENLKYIFANKALSHFFGKEEPEIVGQENFNLVDNALAKEHRKTDLDVLKKKTAIIDEMHWNNRIYKTTKFPVKMVNGAYGVGAYIEDVTESHKNKKKVEKNLLRNQILVDVLSSHFETTQEQLDYVLNESLKLTESKFGYIYLYNEESQEFLLNSWSKDVMAECAVIDKLTKYQLHKTGLWGEVVRQRKPIIVNNFAMPNAMKKGYPEGHVQLTKFMSIPIMIDNQIVAVVGLANKDDDYDNSDVYQITALMNGIWNAKERREAIAELTIERNKFLQTIISIGDGVLVVDLDGKVTMLNKVAEKLTGWTHQDAAGRHYQEVFVLSHADEQKKINDPIEEALITGEIQELDKQAVLTSKNGTKFYIEDSSAPIRDDKNATIGVVLVFRDVTEKMEQRKRIEYLSLHDTLTGLYNRFYFEEELRRLDTKRNLPISIIVGDMNGLKLTNDIFGHDAGDQLLQKIAEVLKRVCRADDIVARVGGDEFNILLPKTKEEDAERIIQRIKDEFAKERVRAIKGSISMGADTKTSIEQDISKIVQNAENKMYSEKAIDRANIKATTIHTIIETFHGHSSEEKEHSIRVSKICESIGRAMNLSEMEIRRLKDAGLYHDIGKIVLDENILNKQEPLTEEELNQIKQHPVFGYRILNLFDETIDLAEPILAHQEFWDGSGYPKGLKGDEIPLVARILSIAESYDAMINRNNNKAMSHDKAIEEMKSQAGKKFDPEIIDVFINLVAEKL